tara:strand:+ start:324 stop:1025 length:702 start_codon:yes stop_codon:yes gene_type:complete
MSPSINPLNQKLAIISGSGNLPLSVINGATFKGWSGVIIDLYDIHKGKNFFEWKVFNYKIGSIGKIFKKLHTEKITHIVLCGGINRPKLHEIKLDLKALDIMSKIAFKGDDSALKIISKEIEKEGFKIIAPSKLLKNSVFPKGHIAGPRTIPNLSKEIKRGYGVLRNLSKSDVGQSVVVQNGIVLAVEALEGTDESNPRTFLPPKKNLFDFDTFSSMPSMFPYSPLIPTTIST